MTDVTTVQPLYDTYNRAALRFERGEGIWLITEGGDRYLDFAAGIAVNSLGHSHPHLVNTLKEQADKLWHLSNLYEVPGQEKLGKRLVDATFADKVFFTNSGAEALECAIKTARRYHYVNGNPERFRVITFEGAFHGRTLATIAAGGQAKYLEGFGPRASIRFHSAMKRRCVPQSPKKLRQFCLSLCRARAVCAGSLKNSCVFCARSATTRVFF